MACTGGLLRPGGKIGVPRYVDATVFDSLTLGTPFATSATSAASRDAAVEIGCGLICGVALGGLELCEWRFLRGNISEVSKCVQVHMRYFVLVIWLSNGKALEFSWKIE